MFRARVILTFIILAIAGMILWHAFLLAMVVLAPEGVSIFLRGLMALVMAVVILGAARSLWRLWTWHPTDPSKNGHP